MLLAPPAPLIPMRSVLIEFRALSDGNMEFGGWDKPDRHGSLMVSVYRWDKKRMGANLPAVLVARAWGDEGTVPHPYEGALYRKTVRVPVAEKGPFTADLYWLPDDWGKIDFYRLIEPGLASSSRPFRPARRVRVSGYFSPLPPVPGA